MVLNMNRETLMLKRSSLKHSSSTTILASYCVVAEEVAVEIVGSGRETTG